MNFIFISPNFPENYWLFCQGLKNNGVNVLAISDAPYEELSSELKNVIQEYYKVSNMENYDEMLLFSLSNMVKSIGLNPITNIGCDKMPSCERILM